MKGFKVIHKSDEFIPEISEFPEFNEKELISSSAKSWHAGKIYFMPGALYDLDVHICWGKHCSNNVVEQGGYMLGNVYRDAATGVLFGIVSRLVPVYGAEGTAAFLDMGTDASYDAVLRENEILQEENNNIRRIGWYHTHPGGLGVFMSGTDMQTQTKSYFHDWQFAVVLNPQKRIWRGFRGSCATEVDCIMVCDKDDPVTSKFIKTPQSYAQNFFGWARKNDNENMEYTQSVIKEMPVVKIEGESLYIGDCIMAINAFMSKIYNRIEIEASNRKSNSISMDLLLQIKEEEEKIDFSTVICSKHVVNFREKRQVVTKFENTNSVTELQNGSVHAIVHYKDEITEEEVSQMEARYNFTAKNELFCVFFKSNDNSVGFFVCDHDRNKIFGEFTC